MGLDWDSQLGSRKIHELGRILVVQSQLVATRVCRGILYTSGLAACAKYETISFEHAYREVNSTADTLAKRGCNLSQGETISFTGRPNFISINLEMPAVSYFRFR